MYAYVFRSKSFLFRFFIALQWLSILAPRDLLHQLVLKLIQAQLFHLARDDSRRRT